MHVLAVSPHQTRRQEGDRNYGKPRSTLPRHNSVKDRHTQIGLAHSALKFLFVHNTGKPAFYRESLFLFICSEYKKGPTTIMS